MIQASVAAQSITTAVTRPKITINNTVPPMKQPSKAKGRRKSKKSKSPTALMHVVVSNEKTGNIELAKVFQVPDELDRFIRGRWKFVPPGRIVAAACTGQCANKLSKSAKTWFRSMGSKDIDKPSWQGAFVFIGVSGRGGGQATDTTPRVNEQRAIGETDAASVTQIFTVSDPNPSKQSSPKPRRKSHLNQVCDHA